MRLRFLGVPSTGSFSSDLAATFCGEFFSSGLTPLKTTEATEFDRRRIFFVGRGFDSINVLARRNIADKLCQCERVTGTLS